MIDWYIEDGKQVTRKVQKIPSGHNPDHYVVRRLHVENEGVKVPVTILHHKSLDFKQQSAPTLLYGYGSYGSSAPQGFSLSALSIVDRGAIYAVAHIRGGAIWDMTGTRRQNSLTRNVPLVILLPLASI